MCLICVQIINVPKEYNLEYNYDTHHSKYDQYKEQLWEVKSALNKQ
jgi:hypothetical protein